MTVTFIAVAIRLLQRLAHSLTEHMTTGHKDPDERARGGCSGAPGDIISVPAAHLKQSNVTAVSIR